MTIQLMTIDTVDDVNKFIHYLIGDLNLIWHPDDAFTDYITQAGEAVFSEREAIALETMQKRAFFVCSEAQTDLYEVGLNLMLERMQG